MGYSDGKYDVRVTPYVEDWLKVCHRSKAEREAIVSKFLLVAELLRSNGVAIGKPHIDQIDGYENLWEIRIKRKTGAYRVFFGLAREGSAIIAAYANVKKDRKFPPRVYELASKRVSEAVEHYDNEKRAQG